MILSLPRIIVNHLISKDNTKKEESIILPFSVMTELEDSDMKQQVEVGKFNVLGKRIIKAYFDPVNVCLNVDNLEHYLSMSDKITEIQKRMSGNKHGKIGNAVQQKPSSQSSAVQLSEDKPKVKVPTYIKIVQVKGWSINVARESGQFAFLSALMLSLQAH